MLTKLEVVLNKNPDLYLNQNISSLFQGLLMQYLDYEFGEILHLSQLKPYSQYVIIQSECIIWNIFTLDKEAKNEIIDKVYSDSRDFIYLEYKDLSLEIRSKQVSTYKYETLIKEHFFGTCKKYATVEFVSPTSFKSNGSYMIFPTIRVIFQSLMNKFDAYSVENAIASQELLEDIEKYVHISSYKLRSVNFHLEGVYIPAFIGRITIKITGTQQLANVISMLLEYGEYSGVGIKTAIGMGGMKLLERR